MDNKQIINEILDFMKYKVNSDTCTPEELHSIADVLSKELDTLGTIEDIAKYFGVSENNVRTMINRRVIDKPKRRVYYRFSSILKNVSDKWLKNRRL